MRERLKQCRESTLDPRLAELASGPLTVVGGAVVLKALLTATVGSPNKHDLTGWEAFVNKVHVEDYLDPDVTGNQRLMQGINYAQAIAERLCAEGRPFTVVLGRDPESDAVTVRFFERHPGERPWIKDDLEGYLLNEIIAWDVLPLQA